MIDLGAIESILEKIQKGSKAADLEGDELDFKSYPGRSGSIPAKKQLSDILMEYAVAFANARGGILILGVEDKIPGSDAFSGCRNFDVDEMKKMVYNTTRPSIMVEIAKLIIEDSTLLLVFIPKSPTVHSTIGGVKYKRVGRENRIIYPEDELTLRVDKGYDYTAGFLYDIDEKAIDLVEVDRLRSWLKRYNPGSDISELDNMEMLESMGLIKKSDKGYLPTVACMLLVGKEEILHNKLPQCETIFLRFEEDDTTPVSSLYLKSPLLKIIDKVWDMIQPYNSVIVIKDALFETPVPSFPEEVIREGLLNALTHRDYSLNDGVYIKLYKDRIEISNPGGFIGDITPDNILTHPSVRRNPLLSDAFLYIGVINKAGLGVDRMYRTLLSYGKMPPEYPNYKDVVVLVIRNEDFDEPLAKFIGRQAKKGHGWKLNELIIIHFLRKSDRITSSHASKLCQISLREAARLLGSMEGIFLERFGRGKDTYYQYNKEIFKTIGDRAKYTRITGLSEERMLQMIENHVNQFDRITNKEVREICGIGRHLSYKLLKKLVVQGKIKSTGNTRGAYYEKCS